MVHVTVLVSERGREVPLEQVSDPQVVRAFRQLAQNAGRSLASVKCPTRKQSARDVRLHIEKNGADVCSSRVSTKSASWARPQVLGLCAWASGWSSAWP